MIKFFAKVLVGSVAVYALNQYFQKTKLPEHLGRLGLQVADGLLTQFAQAQAQAQAAAAAQQRGGTA